MKNMIGKGLLALSVLGLTSQPAQACWNQKSVQAAKIMHLNNMMMVSALRCRKGADNFLSQYNQFIKNNRSLLGGQHSVVKRHFAVKHGQKGAVNALDRFNISLANKYGAGHATMNCKQLKSLAQSMVSQQTLPQLMATADAKAGLPVLPGGQCKQRIASSK